MLTQETIEAYCTLLHRELIPATGCTEPIAIAYAAALLHKTLGALPERMEIGVSGNIRITSYNVCYTKLLRSACRRSWQHPVGLAS